MMTKEQEIAARIRDLCTELEITLREADEKCVNVIIEVTDSNKERKHTLMCGYGGIVKIETKSITKTTHY